MEEEHSLTNDHYHSNDARPLPSDARRLQIRRGVIRQSTAGRSAPYHSSLSNVRRRQTSLIASQTISNLITNLEHPIEPEDAEFTSDNEIVEELVNLSNASPVDLTAVDGKSIAAVDRSAKFVFLLKEYSTFNEDHDVSYHSLSIPDFDPINDDDEEEDEDEPGFYYTSTSIPVFDYSSSAEPTHPIDLPEHRYNREEYSPSTDNDDDLNIEIILESSQNRSLPTAPVPAPRRRRSIIPTNIRTNRGLRSADILSIPQKLYSSLKEQLDEKHPVPSQCYVCLEDFQSIDSIKLLNCQHVFHTECINEWLRHHSNCAYCRTPVVIGMLHASSSERRQRARVRRHHALVSRPAANESVRRTALESPAGERD